MKPDRRGLLRTATALLLAVAFLTGCTRIVNLDNTGETIHLAAEPATEFEPSEAPSAQTVEAAAGANDFAFRFARSLLSCSRDDENFLCSPYSAWLPLAALVNAADEDSRPALLESLGAAGLSTSQLNTAAKEMLAALTQARQNEYRKRDGLETHNPLSIANAVFVDQDARINSDFAEVFAQNYGGAAMSVDFSSPDASAAINEWASEHTEGLIPEIVTPESLDPETVAALANAIYFSDRWDWEFNTEDTAPGDFYAPDGTVQADFMLHDGDLWYYEDDDLQAVQLDFLMGGSMLVLLPKNKDGAGLLSSLDTRRLDEILTNTEDRSGRLLLPRFAMQSDVLSLSDVLQTLGLPLFNETAPPLDGLVDGQSVYLSQAVQSARIEVDEQGTTAAAVTVMAMAGAAMPVPTEPFEMTCDSPFVFLLLGSSVGGEQQILFAGVCNQPEG